MTPGMEVRNRDGGVIGSAGRMALEREIGTRERGDVNRVAAGVVVATDVTGRATGAGERGQIEKDGGRGSVEINGDPDLSGRSLREEVPRQGVGTGAGEIAGRRPRTGRAATRCVFRRLRP